MHLDFRSATSDDAEALLEFLNQLDFEAQYILYDQNERDTNVDKLRSYLEKLSQQSSRMFIAIDNQNKILGYLFGEIQPFNRVAHVVKLNIGILKRTQKRGIAEQLGALCLQYAKQNGIKRAEVTVIKENLASLALCRRMGFEIEGVKRQSIKIGQNYHDEVCLAYLL